VTGLVRGNVAVRGTWDHTSVSGLAQLSLGSLRVNSTGVLYNDITGEVRLRGDSAYVDSLVAHAGGTVRVTGAIDLADLTRPSFNLAIASNAATLLDNRWGRIQADSRLTARGPYAGMRVRGTATITSGLIYAPDMNTRHATNLDDPTLAGVLRASGATPAILPPSNPFLQNLVVDVALRVDPDTWVRNSQANFEIYTPADAGPLRVHMDNAHQTLTLLGTINADRGDYTYAGRVFTLSTGSATFMGGPTIDPLLQASATYTVERRGQEVLPIQVDLSGTLSAPRVTLQSNTQPPLSQSDLLSYLAFGQPASSVLGLQGSPTLTPGGQGSFDGIPTLVEQQTASLAFGAVVDQTVKDIETQGTRAGLDVFRVHPGELPPEATYQGSFQNFLTGTEIEAGKYLTPRFFVELRGRASTFPGLAAQYRERSGFQWLGSWEPRYLPTEPSFSNTLATQRRALGTLFLWTKRF
jgi:translocation and assembly module TamB